MSSKTDPKPATRLAAVTIPELEQSKTAVLNTLAPQHLSNKNTGGIGTGTLPCLINYAEQQAYPLWRVLVVTGTNFYFTAQPRASAPPLVDLVRILRYRRLRPKLFCLAGVSVAGVATSLRR
jgi:hypothetical protein